jgi:hypothetical protein
LMVKFSEGAFSCALDQCDQDRADLRRIA